MQRLWAPWRSQYLKSFEEPTADDEKGCFLCAAAHHPEQDAQRYVVYRGEGAFVILNLYPYNGGHIMVAPYEHVAALEHLNLDAYQSLCTLLRDAIAVLKEEFHPDGLNVGANLGRVAGAGLPDHVHFHIVPRWSGDTNFMPVLADTKVVSQSLEEIYHRLHQAFQRYYHRQ